MQPGQIKCPSCGTFTAELIECDVCNRIGCIRCVMKRSRQWICSGCKGDKPYVAQTESQTAESALSSMFG